MKRTMIAAAVLGTALICSGAAFAAAPASDMSMAAMVANNQKTGMNWFGGPVYNGQPDLAATVALVEAGGGADHFSFPKALVAMLGEKTVNAEVAKLTKQYGKKDVDDFIAGMTWDVDDALKLATAKGIKLPPPADLHGAALAKALVKAGTAPDGTFWSGHMFDATISHGLHNQVMADVDAKFGVENDGNTHKILNQAMFDVAQAEGMKHVKLASFH